MNLRFLIPGDNGGRRTGNIRFRVRRGRPKLLWRGAAVQRCSSAYHVRLGSVAALGEQGCVHRANRARSGDMCGGPARFASEAAAGGHGGGAPTGGHGGGGAPAGGHGDSVAAAGNVDREVAANKLILGSCWSSAMAGARQRWWQDRRSSAPSRSSLQPLRQHHRLSLRPSCLDGTTCAGPASHRL